LKRQKTHHGRESFVRVQIKFSRTIFFSLDVR
jgi:hypothetical protein